jgi:hypothetical protein
MHERRNRSLSVIIGSNGLGRTAKLQFVLGTGRLLYVNAFGRAQKGHIAELLCTLPSALQLSPDEVASS